MEKTRHRRSFDSEQNEREWFGHTMRGTSLISYAGNFTVFMNSNKKGFKSLLIDILSNALPIIINK